MKIRSLLAVLIISFLLSELVLRIFFAYRIGPNLFWYGTPWCSQGYGKTRDWAGLIDKNQPVPEYRTTEFGYFKFFPHQKRIDHDPKTHEAFPVVINAEGFRGKEFSEKKGGGVLRVVTLGASSTFGYGDRDNETYPFYLEEILKRDPLKLPSGIKDVEVINLGVPHLTSGQILALFEHEGLPLHPDVVTFYEGINDVTRNFSEIPTSTRNLETGYSSKVLKSLKEYLLLCAVVWEVIQAKITYPEDTLARFVAGKSEIFTGNLKKIREICDTERIEFFVVSQQARSMSVDPAGMTYKGEAAIITKRLEAEQATRNDIYFLAHDRLTDDLKKWVAQNRVGFIDAISALDHHRETLWSWIHLTPEGNRLLAEAIAGEILAHPPHSDEKSYSGVKAGPGE